MHECCLVKGTALLGGEKMTKMKHESQKKSYSQRKRETMDYSREFYKKNPGIFGKYYICAYCKRILERGRDEIHIDHIMPLDSPLGMNATYNLVPSCATCNLRKSNKVDYRVLMGYTAKFNGTLFYFVTGGLQWVAMTILKLIAVPISAVMRWLQDIGVIKVLLIVVALILIYKFQ